VCPVPRTLCQPNVDMAFALAEALNIPQDDDDDDEEAAQPTSADLIGLKVCLRRHMLRYSGISCIRIYMRHIEASHCRNLVGLDGHEVMLSRLLVE